MLSSISTPQEHLISLNFNTRRNLWPSCILLPLNVNHRMRGNSSNLAICSSFYGFNAMGEIDPVQCCSGGTSLSLSVATRLSPSSVSTSFVCPRFDPRRWGIPPATSSTSVLMPGGGKPPPPSLFAHILTPGGWGTLSAPHSPPFRHQEEGNLSLSACSHSFRHQKGGRALLLSLLSQFRCLTPPSFLVHPDFSARRRETLQVPSPLVHVCFNTRRWEDSSPFTLRDGPPLSFLAISAPG